MCNCLDELANAAMTLLGLGVLFVVSFIIEIAGLAGVVKLYEISLWLAIPAALVYAIISVFILGYWLLLYIGWIRVIWNSDKPREQR